MCIRKHRTSDGKQVSETWKPSLASLKTAQAAKYGEMSFAKVLRAESVLAAKSHRTSHAARPASVLISVNETKSAVPQPHTGCVPVLSSYV